MMEKSPRSCYYQYGNTDTDSTIEKSTGTCFLKDESTGTYSMMEKSPRPCYYKYENTDIDSVIEKSTGGVIERMKVQVLIL